LATPVCVSPNSSSSSPSKSVHFLVSMPVRFWTPISLARTFPVPRYCRAVSTWPQLGLPDWS
jgi:hypothetical protein